MSATALSIFAFTLHLLEVVSTLLMMLTRCERVKTVLLLCLVSTVIMVCCRVHTVMCLARLWSEILLSHEAEQSWWSNGGILFVSPIFLIVNLIGKIAYFIIRRKNEGKYVIEDNFFALHHFNFIE